MNNLYVPSGADQQLENCGLGYFRPLIRSETEL
jgi:hypothetical protein